MIIERLSKEHLNIEKLLAILERELEVFDRGDRADYEVIHAVISYFEVYPEVYHHPQEDLVFAKLRGTRSGCCCEGRRSSSRTPERGPTFTPRRSGGRQRSRGT
ncbi:hypothetical protein J4G43_010555 [Bradyrhizobium barranii subsp. barranii]|uniref:Hemerythrin-like domain-containing protein n=1 Tax=Bradyrhizobium barranii subsp. barranii TaxID=2823807 RepID=A0A9X9Y3Z6_9BRAD|nr:hypothetical protein [Bradyrhizobium barranii]UEM14640.1 hypothetical protein J4G43_010555 [Bradyrhizobium barranii subsp. barranii]